MVAFYSVLSFMTLNTFEYSDPGSFDIISSLPIEMAIAVLRMLPGKDLLNAACVNKNWLRICRSDKKLRQKIRRYVRQQRRALISIRMLGAPRRNRPIHTSNRPAMINVANTTDNTNSQFYRLASEPMTTRYMPYNRNLAFGPAKVTILKRRNSKVGEKIVGRSRLRM